MTDPARALAAEIIIRMAARGLVMQTGPLGSEGYFVSGKLVTKQYFVTTVTLSDESTAIVQTQTFNLEEIEAWAAVLDREPMLTVADIIR